MPKHKRKSNARKKFQGAAIVGATIPVLALSGASPAQAQPADAWHEIMECESGTSNIENPGPSTASGYFQIIDSTWAGAGGLEFAPRAIDATFEQQAIVAQRIAEQRGTLADWNASKYCWGGDITDDTPDGPAFIGGGSTADVPLPADPIVEPEVPVEPEPVANNTYVVTEGESLSSIARELGIADWTELAILNNIADPYIIHVGQILQTPAEAYTVVEGDTLSGIALEQLGTSDWQPLYEQNKETIGENPNLIFPNQILFVGGVVLPQAPVVITQSEEAPAEVVEEATGVVSQFFNPVPGGKITSGYGPRWGEFHNGIDIDGVIGTDIFATTAGQVVAAGCGVQGFECWVRIKDIDGNVHTYGHMLPGMVYVQEGQWVEAGTHIADVGNGGMVVSGSGDGSHLHYRIEDSEGPGALPINPETWLADRGIFLEYA